MVEAEFFLELLVSLLADPARLDGRGQCLEAGVGRQVGPEFGPQTVLRFANLPESRGFLSLGKPGRFAGTGWWS